MTTEKPTLTDAEQGHAYEHFDACETAMGRCYLEGDVQSILADRDKAWQARLAEVEAERDEARQMVEDALTLADKWHAEDDTTQWGDHQKSTCGRRLRALLDNPTTAEGER